MTEDPICPVCSEPIAPGVACRAEGTVHQACWLAATSTDRAESLTAGTTRPAGRRGPKSATILLVEDHDDSRDAFGQILASLGHRVLLAANGREALDLVERGRPDLVFCDLRMPNMDGFQFVAALGARGTLAGLTVIAVTGSALEPAILTRLKAAGFTGHLTKPLDYDAMARVLDELLTTNPGTGRRRHPPKKS